jgi:signal transduction histidine kinase
VRTSDAVEVGLARVDAAFVAALNALRVLTLGVAVATFLLRRHEYDHPRSAALILVLMAAWSAALWLRGTRRPSRWLLLLDVAVTCAAIGATHLVDAPARIAAGAQTVPTLWAGVAIADVAVWSGWSWGLLAAASVSAATVAERGALTRENATSMVLAGLLAATVGRLAELLRWATRRALVAERAAAVAERDRATLLERDRLAREVHDGVLQLLAVVERLDPAVVLPDDQRLGAAAAEQGQRLREMFARPVTSAPADGEVDLVGLLPAGPRVHRAVPAGPVLLPTAVAEAIAAVARAAVDNTRLHVGLDASSWLALDVSPLGLHLVVRDDGPELPEQVLREALDRAAESGRLGVPGMRTRAASVGGRLAVTSPPGAGVEVELEVPLGPAYPTEGS